MDAKVGDEIVVDARRTNAPTRRGEILEVLERGDVEHFRVRWDDGHETVFFPSSDAFVVHLDGTGKRDGQSQTPRRS